jgi:hypothetical protein
MGTSNNAVRDTSAQLEIELNSALSAKERTAGPAVGPQLVRPAASGHVMPSLRMYTEEQVAEMLQVSMSQLRKWRMKENKDRQQGPPFRKVGRLVRYPEQGLNAYINGE